MRRRCRAGAEPAKAQRRKTRARKSRIAQRACAPSQFICCPQGNKGRTAHSRAVVDAKLTTANIWDSVQWAGTNGKHSDKKE